MTTQKSGQQVEYFEHTSPLLNTEDCFKRDGVWSCPHCGKGHAADLGKWNASELLLQAIFDPARYHKAGCIVIIGLCPFCRKPSWIHRYVHDLILDTELDIEPRLHIDLTKLKAEDARMKKAVIDLWARSPCRVCAIRKKDVKKTDYQISIHCDSGNGWSRFGSPEDPDSEYHVCPKCVPPKVSACSTGQE